MQHFWFLFSRGLTRPSRVNILIGIMAYLNSPLWLLFLLFSPVLFIGRAVPVQNTFLFVCSMLLLFVPKVLGAAELMASRGRNQVGGAFKVFVSTVVETILFHAAGADIDVILHAICLVSLFRRVRRLGQAKTRG